MISHFPPHQHLVSPRQLLHQRPCQLVLQLVVQPQHQPPLQLRIQPLQKEKLGVALRSVFSPSDIFFHLLMNQLEAEAEGEGEAESS